MSHRVRVVPVANVAQAGCLPLLNNFRPPSGFLRKRAAPWFHPAALLNEFLKEHRKVDAQKQKIGEQEATISELKSDLQTVVARLRDQDLKIQRVSAKVEMNTRSPHVIATNP